MKPTMEILERIQNNSRNHPDEIFTRLYRYLLRPDLYFAAYKNLYANKGASTKGVDDDTADGFSKEKVERIIQSLEKESYTPKPARRSYIKKKNSKKAASSGNPHLYRQTGAGSPADDFGSGLQTHILPVFPWVSPLPELPHRSQIIEKGIYWCVLVHRGRHQGLL